MRWRAATQSAVTDRVEIGSAYAHGVFFRDMGVSQVDFYDSTAGRSFLGTTVLDLGSIQPDNYVKVMVGSSSEITERCADLRANGVSDSQIITFLRTTEAVEGA